MNFQNPWLTSGSGEGNEGGEEGEEGLGHFQDDAPQSESESFMRRIWVSYAVPTVSYVTPSEFFLLGNSRYNFRVCANAEPDPKAGS
ncbi:hypothetical protein L596_009088 [Steinernema carpocapsae]|uniref:Uncharacterized protein n=1 Tax=Steinernema carpocapsae TaxID=34508 RepID=A0A4U5PFJ5_STECR|nr:hypothetical protein L596_009088 [Steinernema carpocapsae]